MTALYIIATVKQKWGRRVVDGGGPLVTAVQASRDGISPVLTVRR